MKREGSFGTLAQREKRNEDIAFYVDGVAIS
jgi:hypothetical protein